MLELVIYVAHKISEIIFIIYEKCDYSAEIKERLAEIKKKKILLNFNILKFGNLMILNKKIKKYVLLLNL